MKSDSIPEVFDWVKARAECSLLNVFKALELGVREDVDNIKGLINPKENIRFGVESSNRYFSVVRVDNPITGIGWSVNFRCLLEHITVNLGSDKGEELMFTASVTLDNDGRCKLKVGEENLEQWQVRRKALEGIFFAPRQF